MRALGGALGGLAGVLAGHGSATALAALSPRADLWLKGPHGPPFFILLLNAAVYYACLGAGVGEGRGRARAAAGAFSASFLVFLLPMAFATRAFAWGEEPGAAPTMAWFNLVLTAYAAACAAGAFAAGAWSGAAGFRPRAGLLAVAGAAAGYLAGMVLRVLPFLRPSLEPGLLPPLLAVLDGALSGVCVGAALDFAGRKKKSARNFKKQEAVHG